MGPHQKSGLAFTATSPPSKTPPSPLRRLDLPLPTPSPLRCLDLPLPPPPPLRCLDLPLPTPPPLPPLSSSLPPTLPLPWTRSRGLLPMPPPPPRRHGTPPPSAACPEPERGVLVTAPAGGADDLAGVPPELLPPKKRVVRYHPYKAAAAIQEMASGRTQDGPSMEEEEESDGLRAELLRLNIKRQALVLTKPLTPSARSRDRARLVLTDRLVSASPLLGMLAAAECRLVFGAGLPVPAFDRLGRAYRMALRRDPAARTYRLTGQWPLFLSRHAPRAGDAVEVRAFRPSAWQARLDKHGEGGLGMALLHRPSADGHRWTSRERDAADGLLRIAAAAASACRLTGGNGSLESVQLVSSQVSAW